MTSIAFNICQRKFQNGIIVTFDCEWGDCIYDYSTANPPTIRKGVHNEGEIMERDLRGNFSLLSNHFYYFGDEPKRLPLELKYVIKKGRKHLVFKDQV